MLHDPVAVVHVLATALRAAVCGGTGDRNMCGVSTILMLSCTQYGDGLTDYHVLGHDDKAACTRAALQARVHQGGEAQNTRHSPAAPTARVDAAREAPPRDTKLLTARGPAATDYAATTTIAATAHAVRTIATAAHAATAIGAQL